LEKQFLEINFKDLGLIEYKKFLLIQKKLTLLKQNFLIFATHHPVYTVGINKAQNFPFAIPVKRGGSITYFDEGTLMVYFIFNVKSPPLFFRKVRTLMDKFFKNLNSEIFYDKEKPGYYLKNRKIASLGFHYEKGRSNHGVSIHISPNLENFNKINPCNLKGIIATSLKNEGIEISMDEAKKKLQKLIKEVFNETKSNCTE
jgi:lipoyl(octanoyl) transferase